MSAAVTVTIYLNDNTDFHTGFDITAAKLRRVVAFDVEIPCDADGFESLRNEVFSQLNIDTPDKPWAQLYRAGRNRSLSVGDVIVVGESSWAVAPIGWTQLSGTDVAAAMARHAEDGSR